jgi:hypothetical protein
MGQGLYNRQTPDGYPSNEASWSSSGQMATRFEIARALGGNAGAVQDRRQGWRRWSSLRFRSWPNPRYYDAAMPTAARSATREALAQAASPQDWNSFCTCRRPSSCTAEGDAAMQRRTLLHASLLAAAPWACACRAACSPHPRPARGCCSSSCAAPTTRQPAGADSAATSTARCGPTSRSRARPRQRRAAARRRLGPAPGALERDAAVPEEAGLRSFPSPAPTTSRAATSRRRTPSSSARRSTAGATTARAS